MIKSCFGVRFSHAREGRPAPRGLMKDSTTTAAATTTTTTTRGVGCPNDIIAIDERSSRLACASMHSFTRSFIHSRDSSDRPTDRLKARSTPSRRSVLRRSRVGRARRPARSRRRRASFAPHRPRRPSRLARIVGTHESSLAPPSFFSLFCFNFGGGLSVSFPVAVDDARAAGRTHASSFPSSSPSRSLGRASARARRLRAVDEGRRRRLEGGSALVEVIRGTRSSRRRDVGSSGRTRRRA